MNIKLQNEDEIRVKILKALADEGRLKIIRVLYKKGEAMSCGEVGENFKLNKSTVSYHFKTLKEAGLTYTRKEGQNKFVSIRTDTFEKYLPGFLDTL
ncbi:ArsR/SmtB family transcription factor [Ectobacillus polymachus]|uniref:ArsR/SmtB family transcription factor n=1 Tax=Ectobacillus polymachus TaxID=1508806 RepID=UPI003A85CD7B